MLSKTLTKDCWTSILLFLEPTDILNLASTSKIIYRAIATGLVKNKLSGGMINRYKPNFSQWLTLQQIFRDNPKYYWLSGNVGVGKSAVAMVSALEKSKGAKIVVSVPPNLLPQWTDLLEQQFGIKPFIMHQLNKKYKSRTCVDESQIEEKIILATPNVMARKKAFFKKETILVVDECKHIKSFYSNFDHCIAINAFPDKRSKCPIYKIKTNTCITKLAPIKEIVYRLPIPPDFLSKLPNHYLYFAELSTLLSYPFTIDNSLPSIISYKGGSIFRRLFITYKPKPETFYYLENSPKFVKLLELAKTIMESKDNAILFDRNTDYLPYVAFLLEHHGINTILFTTDFNPIQRIALMDKFKQSNGCILLTSYTIMGEGHNLPEANHVICYGSCGDQDMKNQIIGRCQRFKQAKQVYVYHLYSSPVDEYIDNGYLAKYNFLFEGASRCIKVPMIEKIYLGFGAWSYEDGLKETGIDIDAVLEAIENFVVAVGSVGKYNRYGNLFEFTVLEIYRGGNELFVQAQDGRTTITKRKNGKYYEVGTSTCSTEYYF